MKRGEPNCLARWTLLAAALLALLLAGCSEAPEVEVIKPHLGDLVESFEEPGETRLDELYPVNMPVSGLVGRIDLEPGDPVSKGQVLATIDRYPLDKDVAQATARVEELSARQQVQGDTGVEQADRDQARAQLSASQERLKALQAEVQTRKARHEQAVTDLERSQRLYEGGAVPLNQLEQARLAAREARMALEQARREVLAQQRQVDAAAERVGTFSRMIDRRLLELGVLDKQAREARAVLEKSMHAAGKAELRAPLTGTVLERHVQGPQEVAAGTALLTLGDLEQLEVQTEVLTADALRLKPGTPVRFEAAPDRKPLEGHVTRVEPAGFTKRSSLGVEQQRVLVLSGFDEPPIGLGVAYRLQTRFLTGERKGVLVIPRFSALQAADGGFYVFKVEGDALVRQPVSLGLKGDLELEVTEGLSESDWIVKVPDPGLQEGDRVKPLQSG